MSQKFNLRRWELEEISETCDTAIRIKYSLERLNDLGETPGGILMEPDKLYCLASYFETMYNMLVDMGKIDACSTTRSKTLQ